MSNTKDYTITTLSGNLNQYGPLNSPGERAPIIPAGRVRQTTASFPYTVVNGDSRASPLGFKTEQPCSFPAWTWNGKTYNGDVCLISYLKFNSYGGDQSIPMNNSYPVPASCVGATTVFGGGNNPGYLSSPTQTLVSEVNAAFIPNLYRGYPTSPCEFYEFTGSVDEYPVSDKRDCYIMTSSQVSAVTTEPWAVYAETAGGSGPSHNFCLAYPSVTEDSSVVAMYEPLDTSFSISLWFKNDKLAWTGQGGTGLYGTLGVFDISKTGLGGTTGGSYMNVSFGSSSYHSKFYMSFGYGSNGFDGTTFHVYPLENPRVDITDVDSWHHIVLSVAGTAYDDRTYSFYLDGHPLTASLINGSPPASETHTTNLPFSTLDAPSTDNETQFVLFNNLRTSSRMSMGFAGAITEFAYFSGSLNSSQVAELYNGGDGADARYISPSNTT